MIRITEDNTQDTDFRVLRPKESAESTKRSADDSQKRYRWIWWALFGVIAALLVAGIAFMMSKKAVGPILPDTTEDEALHYLYEPETPSSQDSENTEATISPFACNTDKAFTEHTSRIVNDIQLEIYIPHGTRPELAVGTPDITDKSIIFATQAADIRADNGKIVGAFVLKGKPLAWGLSKKGYVAIIEDKITVGVAENSPHFEEATEKEGYFFRQYPLVLEGRAIENEPKGKSVRKAICDRNGEIMVIMTAGAESFYDFAQALADFGVDNAVYLVGSEYSYGFYRDETGRLIQFTQKIRGGQKYENFIIWRKQP